MVTKIFTSLVMVSCLSFLYADEPSSGTDAWPFTCSEKQLQQYKLDRYLIIDGTNESPGFAIDTKTIKIDTKAKLITVWMDSILSPTGSSHTGSALQKEANFPEIGVVKLLMVFDYKNLRDMSKSVNFYDCSGSKILSENSNSKWEPIVPGTGFETILNEIMKEFKIKG